MQISLMQVDVLHGTRHSTLRWALSKSRVILGNGMSSKTVSQKAVQTVSPRQWIGIVVVYLFIPLALLLCGGDFGWWQAWIYSLLIVVAGIGGRIWAEQRHPGLLAERQNMEKVQTCAVDGAECEFPTGHCGRAGSSLWLVTRISVVAHRARLPLDLARIRFRCVGIDREPLFLQRGAYSGGSRACGV